MTFFRPTAILWAALAIPIVMLYLWRIRARRLPISTGFLWDEVVTPHRPRRLWRRWRERVSLGVQLAVLLVLVLAAAEPHLRRPQRTVLVIDNSATMNATDVRPTRLAQAKALARQEIAALGCRDEVAIVSGGEPAQVHAGLTGRQAVLEEALEDVAAGKGASRTLQAVGLARHLLADCPEGRILVFSDGCFDGATELAEASDVRFVAIGGQGDNVAVTALAARRTVADPLRCQVLAEVTSYASEPVDCRLRLELGDRLLDTIPVHLAPGARWQKVYELNDAAAAAENDSRPLAADYLVATLDRPDPFPDDNSAFVRLPGSGVRRVLLVGEPSPYLPKALECNPRVQLTMAETPPANLDAGTILVFHRRVPAALPDGPVLVIDPAGPCQLWQLGEPLADPVVARQDHTSPLLANVRLTGVRLTGARRLIPADKVRPSARPIAWNAGGEPLAYDISHPGGRVVVLGGNLEMGDLAQQIAFPILLADTIAWLSGEPQTEQCFRREATAAGMAFRQPADIRATGSQQDKTDLGATAQPGTPPWLALVAVALALLVVEWCLYQRRWIC